MIVGGNLVWNMPYEITATGSGRPSALDEVVDLQDFRFAGVDADLGKDGHQLFPNASSCY